MNCLVSAIALRRKSLSQFGARATSREELRHRSNRNLPESATTNKLRPLAFPKKQTEKPDCRQAEDGAPQKGPAPRRLCRRAAGLVRPVDPNSARQV